MQIRAAQLNPAGLVINVLVIDEPEIVAENLRTTDRGGPEWTLDKIQEFVARGVRLIPLADDQPDPTPGQRYDERTGFVDSKEWLTERAADAAAAAAELQTRADIAERQAARLRALPDELVHPDELVAIDAKHAALRDAATAQAADVAALEARRDAAPAVAVGDAAPRDVFGASVGAASG